MKYLTRTTFAETVIKLDLLETRPSGNLPRAYAVGLTCKAVGPYSSGARSFVPFQRCCWRPHAPLVASPTARPTPSDKPAQTCRNTLRRGCRGAGKRRSLRVGRFRRRLGAHVTGGPRRDHPRRLRPSTKPARRPARRS